MTNAERMVPYFFKKILLLAHCRRDDHSAQPLRAWRGSWHGCWHDDWVFGLLREEFSY